MTNKHNHILYRKLIYRQFHVVYEFENEKAFFFKIKENKQLKLIKAMKNNDVFSKQVLENLQKIKNDHLTNIEEIYYKNNMNYIKMEFYENSFSLKEFLGKYNKELTYQQFYSILSQIATTVDLLHTHNIAHFDLTYPNILLDDNYNVKITDFDLTKIIMTQNKVNKFVDIHSFIEIVYRLISRISYIDNIVSYEIHYSDKKLDYSSCINFLNSVELSKYEKRL